MRVRLLLSCVVLAACLTAPAAGQFRGADSEGPRLGSASVAHWQAGMIITAAGGPCRGLVGTAPIPIDWPEQQVSIIKEDFSPTAKVSYRMVEGTVKQMVIKVPFLPAGQECKAVVTVEVRRSSQLPPEDTDVYVLPKRLPRDLKPCLGPSPGIESTSSKIRGLARQLGADEEKAWNRVEKIYDWVRTNVQYKQGPRKGAVAALREGVADHEDLTSLFIAICRASGVPARTVWVPGHCYAEFYLQDAERNGHWFPCQVAGSRAFGQMPDHRPILQKGDNFRSPSDRRERKRFLPETLDGAGGTPTVKFIRELASQ